MKTFIFAIALAFLGQGIQAADLDITGFDSIKRTVVDTQKESTVLGMTYRAHDVYCITSLQVTGPTGPGLKAAADRLQEAISVEMEERGSLELVRQNDAKLAVTIPFVGWYDRIAFKTKNGQSFGEVLNPEKGSSSEEYGLILAASGLFCLEN